MRSLEPIFNTGQGAQFTSEAFLGILEQHQNRLSRDCEGCRVDNVFVQRLWRSVQSKEIYLRSYDTALEARSSLAKYFEFYNHERGHQFHNRRTPWQAYTATTLAAAA